MDRPTDDRGSAPSRAETARSAVEDPDSASPEADDPREEFWAFLCRFAVYFYLFGYLVAVFLVLTVVGFLLWFRARADLANPGGPLALLVTSFVLFGTTGVGVYAVLRGCNRL